MTHTDDDLTEAVAKAIYRASQSLYTYEEFKNPVHTWGGVMVVNRKRLNSMATAAITTIRQHDEHAALNCGHCTPNTDEIACGCQIEERDDE